MLEVRADDKGDAVASKPVEDEHAHIDGALSKRQKTGPTNRKFADGYGSDINLD